MMRNKKTVRDSETVAREFIAALEAKAKSRGYSDKYCLGYITSVLAMHADKNLVKELELSIVELTKGIG